MSKHLHFYEIEAGADNSRAMESETIQKNGASPKSLMSRGNFLRKVCLGLLAASIIFCGCGKDNNEISKSDDFVGSKWIGYFENEKVTLDFISKNTYTMTTEEGNNPPRIANGTYTKDGFILTMYYGGNVKPIKGTITNNELLILKWWTVNGTRTASLVRQ